MGFSLRARYTNSESVILLAGKRRGALPEDCHRSADVPGRQPPAETVIREWGRRGYRVCAMDGQPVGTVKLVDKGRPKFIGCPKSALSRTGYSGTTPGRRTTQAFSLRVGARPKSHYLGNMILGLARRRTALIVR